MFSVGDLVRHRRLTSHRGIVTKVRTGEGSFLAGAEVRVQWFPATEPAQWQEPDSIVILSKGAAVYHNVK